MNSDHNANLSEREGGMNNKYPSVIRSSAAEYLTFIAATGEGGVEAVYADENVWLSQKMMAAIFDVTIANISQHLINIFDSNELQEVSVMKRFLVTASDGKKYNTQFYNLDTIISVGYRVKSERASRFRKWANSILEAHIIKGFSMDDERLKMGGTILSDGHFERQLAHIKEIRLSERESDQKITDLYTTAIDYDVDDNLTRRFYASVRNKLSRPLHEASPTDDGYTKGDIAKVEMLVTAYLDMAEKMAHRKIPMTMEDWESRLSHFVNATSREVLQDERKLSAEINRWHTDSEFEKYRIVQDCLYESDFDKGLKDIATPSNTPS